MPVGGHFQKSEENNRVGRARRWWPFEVAAVTAIAMAVAVALIAIPGGHARNGTNRRTASGAAVVKHLHQRTSSGAGAVERTAAQSPVPSSTTTLPVDPYLQPDKTALPVLVVFDGSTITIKGAVPSVAAEHKLSALAEAYSTTPHARVVTNLLVDRRIPASTGVRIIEMNAVRFAEGSSTVTPQYAPSLARVVTVMKAMPTLTALVIGHADQMGDSAQNLTLSYARATNVVQYLVSQGVSPSRLTAQGVGSSSLLTQQSNAAGLALNRRTEFVLYGLLAPS